MDTGLILSISKKKLKQFSRYAAIVIFAACTHVKTIPVISIENKMAEINLSPHAKTLTGFSDKTAEYGLDNFKAVHLYAVKLNQDEYTDLVLLEDFYSSPKFLIFDAKEQKFNPMSYPFKETVRASYLNFVDLDHDGIIDVLVTSLNQKSEMTKQPIRIFRGERKGKELSFVEEGHLDMPISSPGNVSVLDFDLDGEMDIFVANWFENFGASPKINPSYLFKGNGFKFKNISALLEGEFEINKINKEFKNAVPTFGATVCDIDQNGFPDILTNSSNGYFNKMWINQERNSDRFFQDFASESGYASDNDGGKEIKGGNNSFYSLCMDYNNDRIIDILIGNMFQDRDPETRDRSAILTGSQFKFPPTFIRSEIYQEINNLNWSEGDRRGVQIDYDLDGLDDLIVENSGFPPNSRLLFFKQHADHSYEDIAANLGIDLVNPSGVVTIDLNRDGLMDFITGQSDVRVTGSKNRIYVFINEGKREKKGSIKLNLQARLSNSNGISGSAFLITNERKYYKNIVENYGSLPSQNESGVYFSFDNEIPKEIIVAWPVGIKDRLGRTSSLIKIYPLKKYKLQAKHSEFNLCEDGRILNIKKNCY